MKERGITFKDVIDAYTDEKVADLVEKAPLADAVLGMVVKHHPAPHEAIKYRIPQIWKGDLESDVGKALLAGEDDGPTIMDGRQHGIGPCSRSCSNWKAIFLEPLRTDKRFTLLMRKGKVGYNL